MYFVAECVALNSRISLVDSTYIKFNSLYVRGNYLYALIIKTLDCNVSAQVLYSNPNLFCVVES